MNNLPVDKEVVNISNLVEGSSSDIILEKLQYSFDLVNKFIHTHNSEAPDNVVWIKKDDKDPELLKVGFYRDLESTQPPKVKMNFKAPYIQEEKVRIIKCIIKNALKEWGNGVSKSLDKKNKLLLTLDEKEFNVIF